MMQIVDCEQGTEAWFRARMGIPTASEFGTLLMSGKGGGESKTRKTYMRKLAGEIITGELMEQYTNSNMERGKQMEEEARDHYSFIADAEPERIGFVRSGQKGCSPDSFIGKSGMLEVKTALPHILIELIEKDEFPVEHWPQCQGGLWVCEREWIDITVYWPKMPPFIKRAYRDEPYIKQLSDAVDKFNAELAFLVERIRAFGGQKAAA
jgi:hypothetical protein